MVQISCSENGDKNVFLLYPYNFFEVMHIQTQLISIVLNQKSKKTLIYLLYSLLYKKGKLSLALLEDIKSRSFRLQWLTNSGKKPNSAGIGKARAFLTEAIWQRGHVLTALKPVHKSTHCLFKNIKSLWITHRACKTRSRTNRNVMCLL